MRRTIRRTVQGHPAVDGDGVHITRVLGIRTVEDFDPFLMLDSFDSTNPKEYAKGFPWHPHRGIETITYLIDGHIEHQDNLGNKGSIQSGEGQWMTAGSGILHHEKLHPSPRMRGLQTWLNLPKREKMADPAYLDITADKIKIVRDGPATVRVLAGSYGGARGVTPRHIQASFFDVSVTPGGGIVIPTKADETVFVYLIDGDAEIDGSRVPAKTAVLCGPGDEIAVSAPAGGESRFMFFSGKPLREPVAWGGPVVMNSEAELEAAFAELDNGTFIKHRSGRQDADH